MPPQLPIPPIPAGTESPQDSLQEPGTPPPQPTPMVPQEQQKPSAMPKMVQPHPKMKAARGTTFSKSNPRYDGRAHSASPNPSRMMGAAHSNRNVTKMPPPPSAPVQPVY